jgi:hypothetical protein
MATQYAIHSLPTPFFVNDNGGNQAEFFTTFINETGGSAQQQFLIGGPGLTELFVTNGAISALGISYTINPLSRRTV